MLNNSSGVSRILVVLVFCGLGMCARGQESVANVAQVLQPCVTTPPAPGQARSRWRTPRISPSLLSVMDSRYVQLGWAVDGYRRSRVALVGLEQGKYIPAGLADDPGIYFFVPIMSSILHLSLPHSIDLFLGVTIAMGFGIGIAGALRSAETVGGRVFAIILLSCLLVLTVLVGDVYAVQSSFAVAVVPWSVHFARASRVSRSGLVFAFAFGFMAYLVNTLRMHAGTGLLLFVAIIVFGIRERVSQKSLLALTASIGFVAAMGMFSLVIQHRDYYLETQDSTYHPVIAHHPIWHTIYAGLGFLQNDYGMKYDDSIPFAKVNSVDSRVRYLSPEYERILEQAVVTFTVAHPKFVVGTLIAKVGVLLFTFLMCANFGLIAAVHHPKAWPIEAAFAAGLVFTSVPVLLAVPRISYMMGYIAFGILYGITSVEHALHQRRNAYGNRYRLTPRLLSSEASPADQSA